jgi:SAM-dependent methyltransferase
MQYRNTDSDWETLAAHHPYFAVISNPKFDGLSLSPETEQEFFNSGEQHVEDVLALIRGNFDPAFRPQLAVDFGCGVGRVLLALAGKSAKAVGVDVSDTMLSLARKHAAEKALHNIELVHSDNDLSEVPDGYDLLHSVIVFQHIPPARGYHLLETLFQKLRSRGCFYLHLTFAKDRRFLDNAMRHVSVYSTGEASVSILEELPAEGSGLMSMYDYDLNRVFLILMKSGVESTITHFTDHSGCYGVIMCGQKH